MLFAGHGYFLFTQIKSHHTSGQAELQSPLIEANHQYCFSVWYFIPHKETLVIIIKVQISFYRIVNIS